MCGKVNVLITYSETSSIVPIYNESSSSTKTEEKDSGGGIRNIEESDTKKEVVVEQKSGESVPYTSKITMPKIEGALITAEGAGDAMVKSNIVQAVSAVTGLPTYKVQVFKM